jgi:hypothetical protein
LKDVVRKRRYGVIDGGINRMDVGQVERERLWLEGMKKGGRLGNAVR